MGRYTKSNSLSKLSDNLVVQTRYPVEPETKSNLIERRSLDFTSD